MRIRKAKKLVRAREGLPTLTPAELTEVSGGWVVHHHHRRHHRHHRHHRHFPFLF
jgi:hypothetical protein